MTIQDRFLAYAADFEVSYDDNDWQRLGQYFTEQASYDGGDGSPAAHGRDALLQKFREAVDGLDRRMGSREVTLGEVSTEGDTVVAQWTARYETEGVPALEIKGTEYAVFDGELIAKLWDEIPEDQLAVIGAWMEAHGGAMAG
jgi:hypothetical protein